MTKFSLKLRLIISFLTLASLVWIVAAAFSWHENREQLDEFFDTYQLRLARQLAAADWTALRPDAQSAADRIMKNIDNDGEELSLIHI